MLRFSLRDDFIISFVAILAAVFLWIYNVPEVFTAKAKLIPPPAQLKYFNFGYRETLSDSLWLRVLQDMEACDEAIDVTKGITKKCNRGWTFQMLDLITDVTPLFRAPYIFGATTLSVLVEDGPGASQIFEKGLVQFPKDWSLQYRAAYHYMSEDKNLPRAAELLILAGDNGAPNWVYSLAGKLYSEAGQAYLAKSVLEDQIAKMPPEEGMRRRLQERLDEANAILAKANKEGTVK